MDKKTIEGTCEEIMGMLLSKGFTYQVTRFDLENAIIPIRGVDKRTIERWIQILFQFGYIKGLPYHRYEINVPKIPATLYKLLKDHPQTKIE